ncbi:MAG: response regulator [Acidobacteriota bacterium]|nr:response regulator [Acidobacteriota bacterium]
MLAGRKLLLADDSITIQKVVELTFSDEGVNVVCVNNGREAVDLVEEFVPDVVLADVFMPQLNGYEVCEYIKQNEKLKHIPVMLLVGSFEPFDEAEARRVGADDTLTKPFQSIRRLLEKVGVLVAARPPQEQIPTAELPRPDDDRDAEPETLSEAAIEISTADTKPLPPELDRALDEPTTAKKANERKMETKVAETQSRRQDDDALLDLGEFQSAGATDADEFVLDIDLDDIPEYLPVKPSSKATAFAGQESNASGRNEWASNLSRGQQSVFSAAPVADESPAATPDQLAKTQEFPRSVIAPAAEPQQSLSQPAVEREHSQTTQSPATANATIAPDQLSPEVIDAIARRAVEQLSERVVQEIAWEVVPQLAELMIKRQLEEKNS